MAIPPLGFDSFVAYFADDGLVYNVQTNQLLLLDGAWEGANIGNPSLPFYAQPRHFLCLFNDGQDRFLLKVLCPVPFSSLAFDFSTEISTLTGLTLDVVQRVGEVWAPYDFSA